MKTPVLILLFAIGGFNAKADGTCPTQDVVGHYQVTSLSCTDGLEALHSDLRGVEIVPVTHSPEGINAEIQFKGWNIAWGVYRESHGGTNETCEDSPQSKFIRRVFDGAVEEIRFMGSSATLTWPYYGGVTCTWNFIKLRA